MKNTFTKKLAQHTGVILALGVIGFGANNAIAAGPGQHAAKHAIQAIKAADTNNDGLISRAEADAKLPRVAKHFDQLDTNKDGQIAPDEFKAGHAMAKAKLLAHAAKVDGDKDGFVSKAEAEANAPRLAKHFDEIDANKDGKLSREEMQAARKLHKKGV